MRWQTICGALGVSVIICLLASSLDIVRVKGRSMLPTTRDGDYIVAIKSHSPLGGLVLQDASPRGRIVLLRFAGSGGPVSGGVLYVKRVVAVGGDQVRIRAGEVVVNDVVLREPYATYSTSAARYADNWPSSKRDRSVMIPVGRVFVLGDNRSGSLDSRVWGAILESYIIGVELFAVHWRRS